MKKFIVIIIAVAVVASSFVMSSCCGVCAGEVKFKNYKDSIAEGNGDKVSFAVASIDFPVKGDKTLIKSIREWIVMYTQCRLDGKNYQKYVTDVCKRIFDAPKPEDNLPVGYENSFELHKSFDSGRIVTLNGLSYNYSGGTHGVHKSVGVTFRRSDGKVFGKEMFVDCNSADFKRLVKKYMMEYFDANDDESLRKNLFDEAIEGDPNGDWYVKLPGSFLPYIDEEGRVVVMYGLYEIAPYACGEVEACIPAEEVLPLLTEDGKKFLED